VSKIYEALRQNKPESQREQPPPLHPDRQPASQPIDDLLVASREMETLYRSIEAIVARLQGGAMIMFSSAHGGEGKTTVCGSFAVTLAQNFGKSVLILDSDRDQALTRRFGFQGDAMVASSPEGVLQGATRVGARGSIATVPVTSLAGSADDDRSEVEIIASIKDKLAATFDYILIDSPSLADSSWSASIGPTTDGVILVIEAERTRWPVALNAKKKFESSGARVLGVFLNKRRFYIPPRIYRNV
jgi:Mrp family chromosome partitioning ATPase